MISTIFQKCFISDKNLTMRVSISCCCPGIRKVLKKLTGFPLQYYFMMHDINGLVNQYRGGLNVEVNDEKGSILTLSLTGPNKEQICDYLNKLSEVYIQINLDEKNITSSNTIRFIDDQLHEIIDSLKSAGVRLQNFRSENRIINISQEGNALFQQMEALNTEKAEIEIKADILIISRSILKQKRTILKSLPLP